jgi:predicted metalloprotease with PDZ domain
MTGRVAPEVMAYSRPMPRGRSLHGLGLLGLLAMLGSGPGSANAGGMGNTASYIGSTTAKLRAAADTRTSFAYSVRMPDPQRHEFHVQLRFDSLPGDRVQLELPKWNPGAYRLTEAQRNVRGVRAKLVDGKAQKSVGIAKLDENTWEVAHAGAPLIVEYQVYCGKYSGIGGCYLDDEFGFINGVYAFMYAVGHKHRPIELRVSELPGGERAEVVTGLPVRGSGKREHFWASNYDVLVDSPIHAGDVDIVEFELAGRPIRAAMSRAGSWKSDEVREELRRITEAATAVFGPPETALPFTDYTFIVHVLPENSGGLEHLNSTVIGVDPWWFADNRGKRRFWSVAAHEFFHLWNVKRIRPAVLGPFDYDKEVHTTMLWFAEGFTSYYTVLITRRAGLIDEQQTLEDLAKRISSVEIKPSRKAMSVEQSSWEAWAQPEDPDKAYFSYYDKGAVIGLLFDLHLRHATGGQASTDTVFRELWQRWRDTGLGLTPAELEQAFIDQAGPGADELRRMFADYVHGTAELDYDRYLAHAGYRLERKREKLGPWIGVILAAPAPGGDAVVIRCVEHDGPGDRGGLADGDVLRTIDGHPVAPGSYEKILAGLELGKPHTFTVERTGRTLELEVEPIESGAESFKIVSLPEVSAEQQLLREQWLQLQ